MLFYFKFCVKRAVSTVCTQMLKVFNVPKGNKGKLQTWASALFSLFIISSHVSGIKDMCSMLTLLGESFFLMPKDSYKWWGVLLEIFLVTVTCAFQNILASLP